MVAATSIGGLVFSSNPFKSSTELRKNVHYTSSKVAYKHLEQLFIYYATSPRCRRFGRIGVGIQKAQNTKYIHCKGIRTVRKRLKKGSTKNAMLEKVAERARSKAYQNQHRRHYTR